MCNLCFSLFLRLHIRYRMLIETKTKFFTFVLNEETAVLGVSGKSCTYVLKFYGGSKVIISAVRDTRISALMRLAKLGQLIKYWKAKEMRKC